MPNGNSTYCKTRSQPPFFAQMVDLYAKAKVDDALYEKYLPALEKEYAFWMNRSGSVQSDEHTVKMGEGMLNRYYDKGQTPRQESHREDKETVEHSPSQNKYRMDLGGVKICISP